MYVNMHAHKHAPKHTHIHAHTRTCTHTHILAYTHIRTNTGTQEAVQKYRMAKTHRIPDLYRSFSAKVTYI